MLANLLLVNAFPGFLVQLIIGLVVVGVVLWGLSQFPIDPTIARLIRVVVIVVVAIWLLYMLVPLLSGGHSVMR